MANVTEKSKRESQILADGTVRGRDQLLDMSISACDARVLKYLGGVVVYIGRIILSRSRLGFALDAEFSKSDYAQGTRRHILTLGGMHEVTHI